RVEDVELARSRAALTPRLHPPAVAAHLHDAGIIVAVGDEHVAVAIPRHIGWSVERAPSWTRLCARCRSGRRRFDGLGPTAQHQEHAARGAELDDHVRPFVRRPHVALFVDANGMREAKSVEILSDLADECPVGTELEQLRRGGAMYCAPRSGAAEHI